MTVTVPARPIASCYWVAPGRLLAGEYPGSKVEDKARARLRAFLAAGVQVFVDLTEADGHLEPYAALLAEEAAALGLVAQHRRYQIRDMGAPTVGYLREILAAIDEELAAGRMVYVHCWGGIGRTGTVVGAWLVEQGLTGQEALERLPLLRRDVPDSWQPSPQTAAQCELVRNWRPGAG